MDHCVRSLCVDHKFCSVTPALTPHSCVIAQPDPLCCTHPCVTHHHAAHRGCLWTDHSPHYSSVTTCTRLSVAPPIPCLPTITRLERVLARRDPEGFYYLGVARHEEEPGVFLIEFDRPAVQNDRCPSMLQKTSARDIIQYNEAQRHPILPGDNVLAPWEPEQNRYGPGICILGLETRDPVRVTEEEELTVSFWNGKKASVPLGVAVWISPTVHHRIVDALHHPISSQQLREDSSKSSTTYVITDRCTAVSAPLCATDPHHHFHHQHWGHRSVHPHCACCHFPSGHEYRCQEWWPLSPRTTVYIPKQQPGEEEAAYSNSRVRETRRTAEHHIPSSSGSDSEEDEATDSETHLSTQSSMVDSGVNTDSSLWERPRLDTSDRPDWKYWKRSQQEPFYRKPGIIKQRSKAPAKDPRAAVSDLITSTNRSALFETIPDSPARRLTVKDVLVHTELPLSQPKLSAPIAERLGQSEVEKFRREQEVLKKQLQQKLKLREWERKREEESMKKYSESREAHRKKTLQRLHNEELAFQEQEIKNIANMKAKLAANEERNERNLTIAAEDKKREQRRLDHLRNVREKIDQHVFEKCATNEQREIERMATQRQKVDNHYRQVAEKVFQAEQL